jgi:ethanolamine utilization cobalamin adenosyltransferase
VLAADVADAASAQFTANGETVVRLGEVMVANDEARVGFRGRLDLSW